MVALLGEVASSRSLAAAPEAQRARVPMISPGSTNPKVTEVGDYIFRACFIDPFQGAVMARFAVEELKAKRLAILFDFKQDYSVGLAEFFRETAQQARRARSSRTSATPAATSSSARSSPRSAPPSPTRSSCPATTRSSA